MVSQRRARQQVFDEAEDPDNTEAAFMPSPSGFMLGDYPADDVACPQHIPPHGKLLVCQTAGQFVYDGDGVLFEPLRRNAGSTSTL